MEQSKPKTGSYGLKFGLIAGGISLIFSLMLFFQGLHYERNTIAGVIGVAILFAVVAFGIDKFKKDNGGFLKLSDALKIGTAIAVIAGIVGLIYYALLTNDIIESGFMEKATAIAKEKTFADNPKITEEQWEQGLAMQEKFKYLAYPFILIFNAILGLVAGLIFGLIMKKDPA